MALESTPTTTSEIFPDLYAAENIANFPIKPEVNGIPAKLNKIIENAAATNGDFLPRPVHLFKSLTSPEESLTRVTIPKAANVVRP